MKRRTKVIALATSLLVGVSMMGVGFASWVISKSTSETVSGNVTVDAIADATLEFTASAEGESVRFGAPAGATAGTSWLYNTEADTEDLTVVISLTMKGVNKINISHVIGDTAKATSVAPGWTNATTNKLVSENITYTLGSDNDEQYYSISGAEITAQSTADMNTSYTIKVTATFAWGEHFGSSNPYTYYKDKTRSETIATGYKYEGGSLTTDATATYESDAMASLTALNAWLNGKFYNFTFTAATK